MWVFCIMEEIYKDVIGYEGIYQVSNFGNVKSFRFDKEKVLKLSLDSLGYFVVGVRLNNIPKIRRVHQLVAESFLNHKRCGLKLVVNHIDFNKSNNRVENLEIITQRENTNKRHIKSASKYTGVYWSKKPKKWKALITINNKQKHLGYYTDELKASEAYQEALLNLI
jgi:hypothetical protein